MRFLIVAILAFLSIRLVAQTCVHGTEEAVSLVDVANEIVGEARYQAVVCGEGFIKKSVLVFRPMNPRFVAGDGVDRPYVASVIVVLDGAGNVKDAICRAGSDATFCDYAKAQAMRWKFKPGSVSGVRSAWFITEVIVEQKPKSGKP